MSEKELLSAIDDCIRAVEQLKRPASIKFIQEVSQLIADCFKNEKGPCPAILRFVKTENFCLVQHTKNRRIAGHGPFSFLKLRNCQSVRPDLGWSVHRKTDRLFYGIFQYFIPIFCPRESNTTGCVGWII